MTHVQSNPKTTRSSNPPSLNGNLGSDHSLFSFIILAMRCSTSFINALFRRRAPEQPTALKVRGQREALCEAVRAGPMTGPAPPLC